MQQQRRHSRRILGILSLGLLVGVALTTTPAQAVDAVGPYYALPSWDQKKAVAGRYVILTDWNTDAVLDKETGLVWDRTPLITTNTRSGAAVDCVNKNIGGRKGWRLPSVVELTSLIDPSLPAPFVPTSVFTTVSSAIYWSTTMVVDIPADAWSVNFVTGLALHDSKTNGRRVWCVRGGMNADAY